MPEKKINYIGAKKMTNKLNKKIENKKFKVKKIRNKNLYALYKNNKKISQEMKYNEMILYLDYYKI